MQIVRQQDEPQRKHPEAENRQKTENAAEDQQHADCHPGKARPRERDAYGTQNEMARGVVDAKSLGA